MLFLQLHSKGIIMKPKTLFYCALCCFFAWSSMQAQVGIGTTDPNAELEIETTNTGIPALQLNPQSSPNGTETGQLAVIGDKLYMFDNTRKKWLSTETVPITFSRTNSLSAATLRCAGNVTQINSGPIMPFDGTVVAITGNSNNNSSSSNPSKEFDLRIRNGSSTNTTVDFNLSNYTIVDTTQNVDFSAGEHFTVRTLDLDGSGDTVNNPTVTIWIKWRG